MKKTIGFLIMMNVCLILVASVAGQTKSNEKLITADSAGPVKLGMTVREARQAMKGVPFNRTSDGEGVALIAVGPGDDPVMTLYAGEEDPQAPVDDRAKIEFIEVWSPVYQTAEGVRPEMKLSEAEKKYGPVKEIVISEIESREFVDFAKQPKGLQFRLINPNGMAGNYRGTETRTKTYSPGALIFSVQVIGIRNFDDEPKPAFSSVYSDLNKNCKSEGGDDGGHVSTICPGAGDYRIQYFDSATTLEFRAEKGPDFENSVYLASQALNYDTKNRKIEWRMADGKPFAVIMRTYVYQTEDGLIKYPAKPINEFLIVKGLLGFDNIDFRVDAKTADANAKARELADNGYQQAETADLYFKFLDINPFNLKIQKASAAKESWVKFPTQVVVQLIPEFDQFRTRTIEMKSEFADVAENLTVIVTDDGYADDSVRGERYWFEIKKDSVSGVWIVVSAKRAWVCQQNRGHQDYSTEPCL
ncbi:MAG: hypothetical protein R2747_23825 [Pyrinomonadaceae bacterium]